MKRRDFLGGLIAAVALSPVLARLKAEDVPTAPQKDLSHYMAVWVKEQKGNDQRWHCFLKNGEDYIPTDGVLPANAFNVTAVPTQSVRFAPKYKTEWVALA